MPSYIRNTCSGWQIKLTWIKTLFCAPRSSSAVLLYSGGMPRASYGDRHCLTIQQDKDHVTLDFTSRVIDFFTVHSIEQEKGEELVNINDVYLWVPVSLSAVVSKVQYSLNVCLVSPSDRVRRAVCIGSVIGRGAGCYWPPDPRVALFAHSLPGSSPFLSHHLLLPHLQRPSQTLGKACECRQSTAGPSTRTRGEKHAAITVWWNSLFCNFGSSCFKYSELYS